MATFVNTLKTYFFGDGTKKLSKGSRICLLDASGNPIGSDDINSIAKLFDTKEDVVDMGLPSGTLWAKKNIGATSPTGYGWYFSWGNLDAHQEGAGYNFSSDVYNATDAASISANLLLSQDAARANLGAPWKMPSMEQYAELFNSDYTTNEWVTNYEESGVNGLLVTSKINGNVLFFPASGEYNKGTSMYGKGWGGWYLSLSILSSVLCYIMYFNSVVSPNVNNTTRYYGLPIRPVR